MKLTKIKINNFFDKKKILITGASGFVGQNLIKNLSKYNSNIVALYANKKLKFINSNIKLIKCDLTKKIPKKISKIKFDIIIHLAGPKADRKSMKDESKILTGILIDKNIIELAIKNKVKTFFYASTAGVYDTRIKTFNEKKISLNYNSDGLYGFSKLLGEEILLKSFKKSNLKICRFFSIYGKNSKTIINFWEKKIKNNHNIEIWGDGKTIRSWLHINDAISGIIQILVYPNKNIFFNLGSYEKLTLNRIFKIIKSKYVNSKSKIKYKMSINSGPKNRYTNSDEMKKIGWTQKVKLKEGIYFI